MKSQKNNKAILILIILLLLVIGIVTLVLSRNSEDYKIPVIKITLNGTDLNTITNNSKNIKYSNNNFKYYDNKLKLNEKITIKGRGNTTWMWPKKPFQITFNKDVNLLNRGNSNKYVLLGNYADPSLLRNHIAFYMADILKMDFSLIGKNVDLYIDNDYQGVYYLTNKVEISESSVNLKSDDAILIELDNIYYKDEEYIVSDIYQDHLVVKDVKNKNNKEELFKNFMIKYKQLEEATKNKNFDEIKSIIDVDSLAKEFIIYQLTMNGDAFRTSSFMYMDGKDDSIHFGPVWDFDRAYSNPISKSLDNVVDKEFDFKADDAKTYNQYSMMFWEITEMDEFKKICGEIYTKYMNNKIDDIVGEINRKYKLLKESADKSIEKWSYLNDYDYYVKELKTAVINYYNTATRVFMGI